MKKIIFILITLTLNTFCTRNGQRICFLYYPDDKLSSAENFQKMKETALRTQCAQEYDTAGNVIKPIGITEPVKDYDRQDGAIHYCFRCIYPK